MDKEKPNFNLAGKRKDKGLTQQELAELSGLTVRTIQRIEKGEVVPYADSMRKLAGVLQLSAAEMKLATQEAHTDETAETGILSYFHFLPLIAVAFPFVNSLISLFLWINYRDKHLLYDYNGRLTINFQLTISIFTLCAIVLLLVYFPVGFVMLIVTYLYFIICCILNGIRALNRQQPKYYQYIPFLKIPKLNS